MGRNEDETMKSGTEETNERVEHTMMQEEGVDTVIETKEGQGNNNYEECRTSNDE